jgi:hypothetical protein
MSTPIRFGIYYGLVSIIIALLSYYILPNPISLGIQTIVSLILTILFMVLSGLAVRRENEGILSYGNALKATFITVVVAGLIGTVFTISLIGFIDPDLALVIEDLANEFNMNIAKSFGANEEALMDLEEQQLEKRGTAITPVTMVIGFISNLVFAFILAMIVSLFVKKNPE